MAPDLDEIRRFIVSRSPFDLLPPDTLDALIPKLEELPVAEGETIYAAGDQVPGLFLVAAGAVEIVSPAGHRVSRVAGGDGFGERGLLRDGYAPNRAVAAAPGRLYLTPTPVFLDLLETQDAFGAFFKGRPARLAATSDGALLIMRLVDLMTPDPACLSPADTVGQAAERMRELDISSLLVTEGEQLRGVLTTGDLTNRVLARGLGGDVPIHRVMSPDPLALAPDATGFDALILMAERGIGHLPVVVGRRPVGIVTRTNLLRHQAVSTISLIGEIARRDEPAALAEVVAGVPQLLVQLVGAGTEPHIVGRLISSVADAATLRLLQLGEARLGPPPSPYLWLACGSQGRQEQTGVSDQDNCMILGERVDDAQAAYFAELAAFVCDGLA
ncbi:MAG: DUF294 nucleotidyltransferase-like domain-containing protein, partial [Geminicoccaceae bacterium]|nr:DUF294 nucleotidyltransferase-like domain-containing protein [Geminicoccaceae bacterium]